MITVEYYGPAKAITNIASEQVELGVLSLRDLLGYLQKTYGDEFLSFIIRSCGVTVELDYVDLPIVPEGASDEEVMKLVNAIDMKLEAGNEVAIIPPVSSG